MIDYNQVLDDLHNGKINQYEVSLADFIKFQNVLMNYRYRKSIVGKAQKGGNIIYYCDNNENL